MQMDRGDILSRGLVTQPELLILQHWLSCSSQPVLSTLLQLVNQAITFKALLKPKVTEERSPNHWKTDQIIKPGVNLKDLGPPRSH